MSADKSWTNPSFQNDDFDMRSSVGENYQIPRVGINREASHRTSLTEAGNESDPRRPHYGSTIEDKSDHDAEPAGRNGKYSIAMPKDDDDEEDYSLFSYLKDLPGYEAAEDKFRGCFKGTDVYKVITKAVLSLLFLGYIAYFVAVLMISYNVEDENFWCDGAGFFLLVNCVVFTFLFYFKILKPIIGKRVYKKFKAFCDENSAFTKARTIFSNRYVTTACYLIAIAVVVLFVVIDSKDDRSRLVSLLGIFVLIFLGFIFSVAPRKVIWRHVIWGLGLQFVMGLIILRWSVGRHVFECFGKKVSTFLLFSDEGSKFVYGKIVSELHVFAFKVLTVILFSSFCIQILYYFGAMQWIVIKLGWLLQISVGTTACESVNAAANIFLGQTTAPLLIKPFLAQMTKSELHAVMTGGFATIAGAILAAYINFGVDSVHLLSASVMSAPAALGFAKLFYPETEVSKTLAKNIKIEKGSESNVLHAACEGVISAIPLVANIAANLLAFIAFIAFADAILNWTCVLVGAQDQVCSLSNIFGYVLMPLAWVMGVPWADCYIVGQLIGTKTFVNEFIGYLKLTEHVTNGEISKRAEIIATYALCGFSNISGIGIQIGALGAMAPERRGDLAQIALRAMIAGSAACFLTACVAGSLITVIDFPAALTDVASNSTVL